MSFTIGELGKAFGLSRSTLLYYDKLNLLKPTARSRTNYRYYSEKDYRRLAKIVTYRDTGMSLKAIKALLDGSGANDTVAVLESRLEKLNQEIAVLRKQQQITLELLGADGIGLPSRVMNKEQWVNLLASIGLSDSEMMQWHREFEQRMPQAHQDFLESLSIPAKEISQIRRLSQSKSSESD